MRVARVLLADVHQDVSAAAVGVRVVDEVDLDVVSVPDDRHGVVRVLPMQLEAQDAVERQGPGEVLHADPDVIHAADVDCACHPCPPLRWSRYRPRTKSATASPISSGLSSWMKCEPLTVTSL